MTEHDKLQKAKKTDDATQLVGEFLHDFLTFKKRIVLAKYHDHTDACRDEDGDIACGTPDGALTPVNVSSDALLYEFFGIDRNKLMAEKDAILAELRSKK